MIWKKDNRKIDQAEAMLLSDFQLWALNEVVRKADLSGVEYFCVTVDIVRHNLSRDFGHQIKVSFLNSDNRIWINANSLSYENKDRKLIMSEVEDFDIENDFRANFINILKEVVPKLT